MTKQKYTLIQYNTIDVSKKNLGHNIIHNLQLNEQNFTLHLSMFLLSKNLFLYLTLFLVGCSTQSCCCHVSASNGLYLFNSTELWL